VSIVRAAIFAFTLILSLAATSTASAIDLTGSWSGDWLSCTSGHKGPLQGEFCRVDNCHYEVRFKGRFFKVFPFRYAVKLQIVEETADKVVLSGSQNLGRLFGTFTYSATVTDNCFLATYTSCKDDGQFRMERCTRPCNIQACEPDCCESP
jgi:hypothetical protein